MVNCARPRPTPPRRCRGHRGLGSAGWLAGALLSLPVGAWAQSGNGDLGMGTIVAIAGGAVVVLVAGVAFVFWNRRRSAAEQVVAPPPIEIKPIVPRVARPRPATPRPGVAETSDENLLQFGAVGKMNVPSKRPAPQVPATAPPLPPESPASPKAAAPAPPEPPRDAPPKMPSSSAPAPAGMPSVPSGLTPAAVKPMSLVPDLASPPAAAPVAAAGIALAQAGAADVEAFLNEPPKPGDPADKPVATLTLDLGSFEPPKAAPTPVVATHPPAGDVPSLRLDLTAPMVAAAEPIAAAPLAFAELPALKLEDFFELQPVADLIHNEDTAPDLAPGIGLIDGGPPAIILGDFQPTAPLESAAEPAAMAFEGVPSISLDLPDLKPGLDPTNAT